MDPTGNEADVPNGEKKIPWRFLIFECLKETGDVNYEEDLSELKNLKMVRFFYYVACYTWTHSDNEQQITTDNLTSEEKKTVNRYLVQFARNFMPIEEMHLTEHEYQVVKGINTFRIELLPILIKFATGEMNWHSKADVFLRLLWWQERCRYFLLTSCPKEEVFECTSVAEYNRRREWWSGEVRIDHQRLLRFNNEYNLED